jgi:hypothetical protein
LAGQLSLEERRGLDPALREGVSEMLLDRYLAEQGLVDLLEGRRAYTKHIGVLSPEDLPALIEAESYGPRSAARRAIASGWCARCKRI